MCTHAANRVVSEQPKANNEKKEGRTKARTQQTQEQGREEAKEEE
jgi:hypothetical protein